MSKTKNVSKPPAGGTSRREQLRQQQAQAAREHKIRTWTTIGIAGVVLALIVGAVIWSITNSSTGTPSTASRDVATQDYALVIGEQDAPVTISIYQDYMCPYCGPFERANRDDLEALVADGTAKVELHLMNFLDPQSQGTNFSTRSANALVTVANAEPEYAMAFNAAIYDNQPGEGTSGLSDDELVALARGVGVSDAVSATFADLANADFVNGSNAAAYAAGIKSTPTVKINGEDFTGSQIFTAGALRSAVENAAG
jgi:protein-disulfide isomerase